MRVLGRVLFCLSVGVIACAKPVPPEKAAYVGEWRNRTMNLLITQDGSVEYRRLKGGVTTSVSGPLRSFDGANFEVGVAIFSTTFVVDTPPYQDGGSWKMVVDGAELTKVE